MTTLANLRTEVRRRLGETATDFYTDDDILDLLNEAQRDFASTGGIVEGDRGYAIVANQYYYTPPSDFINMRYVLWQERDKLRYTTQRELFNILREDPDKEGVPQYYAVWDGEIRLYPTPTSASGSTAVDDTGDIDSSQATITVDSTADFPTRGRILIDSEEIQYYNKSATEFLQCVRGVAGTTAAAHLDNAVVSELEMRMFYYKDPTALVGDSTEPEIPAQYHEALVYYAVGMLMMKSSLHGEAQLPLGIYEQKKANARREIKMRQRDRNPRVWPYDIGRRTNMGPA